MEMQSMTKEFQTKVTLWIVVEDFALFDAHTCPLLPWMASLQKL